MKHASQFYSFSMTSIKNLREHIPSWGWTLWSWRQEQSELLVSVFPDCPQKTLSLRNFAFSGHSTRREGEGFTFSNIYLCIQYQVHKCKYPESIIRSIRNYRESNTNCNKVNMLVLFTIHVNQPVSPTQQKYCMFFFWGGVIHLFNYFKLYKTDYQKYGRLFLFLCCVLEKH